MNSVVLHISDLHSNPFYDPIDLGHFRLRNEKDSFSQCKSNDGILFDMGLLDTAKEIMGDSYDYVKDSSLYAMYKKKPTSDPQSGPVSFRTRDYTALQFPAYYGRFGCDPPLALINQALADVKKQVKNFNDKNIQIEAVIFTGDLVVHQLEEVESNVFIRDGIRFAIMKRGLLALREVVGPDVPIYLTLGNNDSEPNYGHPGFPYFSTLVEKVFSHPSINISGFSDPSSTSTFKECGYYATTLKKRVQISHDTSTSMSNKDHITVEKDADVRVIVLNTNIMSGNFWSGDESKTRDKAHRLDKKDPCGQVTWFREELEKVSMNGQKECQGIIDSFDRKRCEKQNRAWILGHISPQMTAINEPWLPADALTEMDPFLATSLIDAVASSTYVNPVLFFGHTHRPTFQSIHSSAISQMLPILNSDANTQKVISDEIHNPTFDAFVESILKDPTATWRQGEIAIMKKLEESLSQTDSIFKANAFTSGSISPVQRNNPSWQYYPMKPDRVFGYPLLLNLIVRSAELYPENDLGTYATPGKEDDEAPEFKEVFNFQDKLYPLSKHSFVLSPEKVGKLNLYSDQPSISNDLWAVRQPGTSKITGWLQQCSRLRLGIDEMATCMMKEFVSRKFTARVRHEARNKRSSNSLLKATSNLSQHEMDFILRDIINENLVLVNNKKLKMSTGSSQLANEDKFVSCVNGFRCIKEGVEMENLISSSVSNLVNDEVIRF